MKKINENTKITLSIAQIKKLIRESDNTFDFNGNLDESDPNVVGADDRLPKYLVNPHKLNDPDRKRMNDGIRADITSNELIAKSDKKDGDDNFYVRIRVLFAELELAMHELDHEKTKAKCNELKAELDELLSRLK